MPRGVMDLLKCWKAGFGRTRNLVIWEAVPHCLLWCVWREQNDLLRGEDAICWI